MGCWEGLIFPCCRFRPPFHEPSRDHYQGTIIGGYDFFGGLKLLQIAQPRSPLKKYWLVPNVKASGKDSFECNIEQCLLNLCLFFNTDLCDKQGVNGYPTIKYYKYGAFVVEYDGDRTEEDFLAFMKAPPNPLPPDQPDSKPHDTRDEL